MFMPGRNAEQERLEKQKTFKIVEQYCLEIIPEKLRGTCQVSIQEVQCFDPNCAPIDTSITLFFDSGGQGMLKLPMEAKEVSMEDLRHAFPTYEILVKWHRGEEAEWPPEEEEEPTQLRFDVGAKVLCRVGANDWAPGEILQLWFREEQWPEGAFAPYRVKLDDGREIFAPADMEHVIKENPDATDNVGNSVVAMSE